MNDFTDLARAAVAVPPIDLAAVDAHIRMIHQLAASSGVDGVLVLFGVGENPATGRREGPRVGHFRIGDADGMIEAAKAYSRTPHLNVYAPWAVFRTELPKGSKGSEHDVVAVLALVADQDNDKGQGGTLPIAAPYIVESSSGNFQAVYPLSRALPPAEAKPLSQALAECVGCDHRTKDVSGVWRIPGLLNWPNKTKVGRGRSIDPQPVTVAKEWGGELIDPGALPVLAGRSKREDRTPRQEDSTRREREQNPRADSAVEELLARCPAALRKLISAPAEPGEDRSAVAFSVICGLLTRGFSPDDIRRLIEAHPSGIGGRYAAGKDLDADIRRGQEKNRPNDAVETPEAWEAPIPIASSLPPVEPFAPEMLPEAIRAYVFDVADRQQSVPDFVAVAALSGIAALIGNRARIAPKQHDDWIEVPNLWGAIIGPPSAMKSPAMQSALGPVYALQDEMREAWKAEIERADIDDVLSGIDAKEARKRAAKAMRDGDRDAARAILAEVSKSDDEEPPCPRIVVNDVTIEKLGELLNENPRGLLLIRDELPGFLARMENEEYAGERAFYLEAFNGSGRFTYDRIGRGTVHIANCTLSIIGGVQPSRIAPIVRGALTGASNDGLIQRLQLAVWPDSRADWQWVDRHPDPAARDAYDKVFRDLYELSLGTPNGPSVFRFSAAAQAMFREWMTEIQSEARSGKLSPVLESHLLKMPKTVASLALIFELIEGGRFEVGEGATLRALAWADYLRSHANRLYSSGDTMAEDGARLILERRHQLSPEFTMRSIHQRGWAGLVDRDVVIAAIDLLVATHHCREVEKPAASAGGRPTTSYCWNPRLAGA